MIRFAITYLLPTDDGDEGGCTIHCEGHESYALMEPHEWGHAMGRVLRVMEEYYEKCLRVNIETTEEDIKRAQLAVWQGVACETNRPTTYLKQQGGTKH